MLSIYSITNEEYINAATADKTDDRLFFLKDTGEIYKGTELYSKSVEFVSEFPSNPAINRLYINATTLEGRVYDGSSWTTVLNPIQNVVDSSNTISGVTGKAVVDYVMAYINTINAELETTVRKDAIVTRLANTTADASDEKIASEKSILAALEWRTSIN